MAEGQGRNPNGGGNNRRRRNNKKGKGSGGGGGDSSNNSNGGGAGEQKPIQGNRGRNNNNRRGKGKGAGGAAGGGGGGRQPKQEPSLTALPKSRPTTAQGTAANNGNPNNVSGGPKKTSNRRNRNRKGRNGKGAASVDESGAPNPPSNTPKKKASLWDGPTIGTPTGIPTRPSVPQKAPQPQRVKGKSGAAPKKKAKSLRDPGTEWATINRIKVDLTGLPPNFQPCELEKLIDVLTPTIKNYEYDFHHGEVNYFMYHCARAEVFLKPKEAESVGVAFGSKKVGLSRTPEARGLGGIPGDAFLAALVTASEDAEEEARRKLEKEEAQKEGEENGENGEDGNSVKKKEPTNSLLANSAALNGEADEDELAEEPSIYVVRAEAFPFTGRPKNVRLYKVGGGKRILTFGTVKSNSDPKSVPSGVTAPGDLGDLAKLRVDIGLRVKKEEWSSEFNEPAPNSHWIAKNPGYVPNPAGDGTVLEQNALFQVFLLKQQEQIKRDEKYIARGEWDPETAKKKPAKVSAMIAALAAENTRMNARDGFRASRENSSRSKLLMSRRAKLSARAAAKRGGSGSSEWVATNDKKRKKKKKKRDARREAGGSKRSSDRKKKKKSPSSSASAAPGGRMKKPVSLWGDAPAL